MEKVLELWFTGGTCFFVFDLTDECLCDIMTTYRLYLNEKQVDPDHSLVINHAVYDMSKIMVIRVADIDRSIHNRQKKLQGNQLTLQEMQVKKLLREVSFDDGIGESDDL